MNNPSNDPKGHAETIFIVGAGAAGLMAALELSAAGKTVFLLEANAVAGGRIRTLHGEGFSLPVEEGAEFVHGDLPLTLRLLRSARIPFHQSKGKMVNVRKGKWLGQGDVHEGWGILMEKMQQIGEDMPLSVFLSTRFPDEKYAGLRDSARRFAQGFDLADIHTVSTRALYEEWNAEEHGQYRIEGGYGRLIDWMMEECSRAGCRIHLSAPVETITWGKGRVHLNTAKGQQFTGGQAIITVPLGMLHAAYELQKETGPDGNRPLISGNRPASHGEAIRFAPGIHDHLNAAAKMGYGTVVKILFQFTDCFWNKKEKKLGFVISDEPIPTWWTQCPTDYPLLTAWIPGPVMKNLGGFTGQDRDKEGSLTELCLSSLANIFDIRLPELRQKMVAVKIVDWAGQPYIRGGYSFETVESAAARRLLDQPIEDTLYFAGEALYEGESPGTVEAALENGLRIAGKIIARQK